MAGERHRTRAEIEVALTERRVYRARLIFELARDVVLLIITVAFAVVAIICALRGYHWPALATGGSSGLTAAVGMLGQRGGDR
jgi:hypothetical protein